MFRSMGVRRHSRSQRSFPTRHEAKDAAVFVSAGGIGTPGKAAVVATDGAMTELPNPATRDFIGRFRVVDVPARMQYFSGPQRSQWRARSAQEVREFLRAPTV